MTHKNLHKLCDIASAAHARFEQEVAGVNSIVGVSQNMRMSGVPADAMTIDSLNNGKRIILVLHDEKPNSIDYQFAWRDKDPENSFAERSFDDLTADTIFEWMKSYLAVE